MQAGPRAGLGPGRGHCFVVDARRPVYLVRPPVPGGWRLAGRHGEPLPAGWAGSASHGGAGWVAYPGGAPTPPGNGLGRCLASLPLPFSSPLPSPTFPIPTLDARTGVLCRNHSVVELFLARALRPSAPSPSPRAVPSDNKRRDNNNNTWQRRRAAAASGRQRVPPEGHLQPKLVGAPLGGKGKVHRRLPHCHSATPQPRPRPPAACRGRPQAGGGARPCARHPPLRHSQGLFVSLFFCCFFYRTVCAAARAKIGLQGRHDQP